MNITLSMRSLFTLAALATFAFASAQIVIGPGDMPSVGDTLKYNTALPMDADVVTTGPGSLWDFSSLVAVTEEENILVSVSSTPLLYQFYFNNAFLYPNHVASFAMEGTAFSFQGLTVSDVYDYFRTDPTGYRNVGFGAMVNGLPTSVRRQPIDRIHQLPLTYADVDSSFSTWEITVPTLLYFKQEQWRYNTADGWGTLHLPADTFEVIRVRSVLRRHDSVHVAQLGSGFGFDEPETVEYKWLAAGMGRPVLMITTVAGSPTSIEFYQDEALQTDIRQADALGGLLMYPNPVVDRLHFRSPAPIHGRLHVRDVQGRVVLTSADLAGATDWNISVGSLPPGNYTVELQGLAPWQGRFMVSH